MEIRLDDEIKKEVVLFIFEGKKPEESIENSLKNIFFNDKKIVKCIYGSSIYSLYSQIKEYEVVNMAILLREILESKMKEQLKNIENDDISEIYLFFDHDAHNGNASEIKLESLLIDVFNNQYKNGKLYISYPMIEAIKEINDLENNNCLVNCKWKISKNISYKERISQNIKNFKIFEISNAAEYTRNIWEVILLHNWKKANCLINNKYEVVDYKTLLGFEQSIIHKYQKKHIQQNSEIMTLSSIPFFLLEFLSKEEVENILNRDKTLAKVCEQN